jgi:hypothetical protein
MREAGSSMVKRSDIKVAAAAGLSVYLPLYWLATRPESDGTPNPLTAFEVGLLLLTLALYLLAPFVLSLLSRYTLAARTPPWLSISAVGSAMLVAAGVAARVVTRQPITVEDTVLTWLVMSLWTMPASAWVYYFGPVVDLIKAWSRGPDYAPLNLRR